MKDFSKYFFFILLFSSCISMNDVHDLTTDERNLYPICTDDKWGFSNSNGITVIEPMYEEVDFFYRGLALAKQNGKYGYIRKDGEWHIKPKYDSAKSFISNCTKVSIRNKTKIINRLGRSARENECFAMEIGGCKVNALANPNGFFTKIKGKYELIYSYYLVFDSLNVVQLNDTSNLEIDEILPFSREHILIRKNDKYALFDTWEFGYKTISLSTNDRKVLHNKVSSFFDFKYDEIIFERFLENGASSAKVRIGNKYGVIDSGGNLLVDVRFEKLEIKSGYQLALVEFEPNKFGYIDFNGNEYFKRE